MLSRAHSSRDHTTSLVRKKQWKALKKCIYERDASHGQIGKKRNADQRAKYTSHLNKTK